MRLSLGKTVVFLSTILSLALLTGCSLGTAEMEKTDIDVLSEKNSRSWEQAETTPLGKYPELVTYTLGQMKGANNSNLPDGQTYEEIQELAPETLPEEKTSLMEKLKADRPEHEARQIAPPAPERER